MRTRLRSRPGFALAIALAAIVIIGAIITGMFFASTQDYRISRNSAMQARALTAAEYGLNNVTTSGQWNPVWNTATNGLLATQSFLPGDGAFDTVRVTKLNSGMFMLTSTGRVGPASGAQARHRVGALVTLLIPQINMLGALTTRGSAKIGGSSYLDGNDTTYAGWNCPPPGAGVAGLSMPDTTKISTSGCSGLSCVAGSPQVSQDSMAGKDSTYFNFGSGLNWSDLVGMANKTVSSGATLTAIGPTVSGGNCDTGSATNWGDPLHIDPSVSSCQSYFPIIYAQGNLHLSGGEGQGILLVEGDLTVTGGLEFYGPVIVKGSMSTTGTGGHFNGGVMAANVDLEQSTLLGNAVIHYSSCAINKALAGVATPVFTNSRSWTELY
jgi:Tfp pilus assembly protein PilV